MEYFHWSIDPVFLHLGMLSIRWYGLLFVGGLLIGSHILRWIYKREGKDPSSIDDYLVYMIIGVIIGARLVHTLFYEPDYFLSHPIEILYIWKGGLASHGGMIGAIIATYLYAKRYGLDFIWLLSRLAIPAALASSLIRIGNFFNSEIIGIKAEGIPWAIVFEKVDMIPRHPSQLYEAIAYFIIFIILLLVYLQNSPKRSTKLLGGLYIVLVFSIRFILEFWKSRQADYILSSNLNVGQLLSIPFILVGIFWLVYANFLQSRKEKE